MTTFKMSAPSDDPLYEAVVNELEKLKGVIQIAFADKKLTIAETFSVIQQSVVSLTAVVSTFTSVDPVLRKNAVVSAVTYLYNTVLAPFDIPGVPNFIEPMVDKAIGSLIEPLVSAAYDAVVNALEFLLPSVTPVTPHVFTSAGEAEAGLSSHAREAIMAMSGEGE